MHLEAELDELLRDAGWAGMSWHALSTKYAKVETADLKTALNHLIARKSIYRFLSAAWHRPYRSGLDALLFLLASERAACAIAEAFCSGGVV